MLKVHLLFNTQKKEKFFEVSESCSKKYELGFFNTYASRSLMIPVS